MGSDASPFWVLMSKKPKILDLIFFKIKTKLAFFAFLHYYEQKRGVWGGVGGYPSQYVSLLSHFIFRFDCKLAFF